MTERTTKLANLDYSIHYRVWHDDSEAHAHEMARRHALQLQPLLPPDRGAKCLDIGCGMGFAMLALRDLGFQNVAGIDIDRAQVGAAARRGLAVDRVADTSAYLLARPRTYDVILLLDVLEHVAVMEQIHLLQAIHSALRAGGRIIVQVPNANSPLASRWRYIDYTHTSSFTEHSLAFVLANAGFINIDIPAAPDPPFPRLPRRFWRAAGWRSFADHLRRWATRSLWRHIVVAELGTGRGADKVSLELNLLGVAFKADVESQ